MRLVQEFFSRVSVPSSGSSLMAYMFDVRVARGDRSRELYPRMDMEDDPGSPVAGVGR